MGKARHLSMSRRALDENNVPDETEFDVDAV